MYVIDEMAIPGAELEHMSVWSNKLVKVAFAQGLPNGLAALVKGEACLVVSLLIHDRGRTVCLLEFAGEPGVYPSRILIGFQADPHGGRSWPGLVERQYLANMASAQGVSSWKRLTGE
jgi:hypothetical protein